MTGNSHTIEMMKVLVTGGTGFIGSHLVDFLSGRGAKIFALVRDPAKAAELGRGNVTILEGDLFSFPPVPAEVDIVFHLAGKTRAFKIADYYTVNQGGTASLFRHLLASRVRPKVIYLSSLAASGPSHGNGGVKESDSPHPVTHYGRSKLAGEEEVLRFKDRFPVVIVRASAVFGPKDRDFCAYFKAVKRGILPTVRGNKSASMCYAKDLVRALDLCARKELPSGEILNIADPQPYTWEKIGEIAGRALGKKFTRVRLPMGLLFLVSLLTEVQGRLKREPAILSHDKYIDLKQPGWVADVSKAAALLPFQTSYSLDRAIRETVDWYIAEKWL
jgi:dihydroflavonol-4-reductase